MEEGKKTMGNIFDSEEDIKNFVDRFWDKYVDDLCEKTIESLDNNDKLDKNIEIFSNYLIKSVEKKLNKDYLSKRMIEMYQIKSKNTILLFYGKI